MQQFQTNGSNASIFSFTTPETSTQTTPIQTPKVREYVFLILIQTYQLYTSITNNPVTVVNVPTAPIQIHIYHPIINVLNTSRNMNRFKYIVNLNVADICKEYYLQTSISRSLLSMRHQRPVSPLVLVNAPSQ